MPKRFLRLFFAVFLALTALFAGTIYVVDPYYHYHGPVAGLPLWLQDGRYQNVGAAENLDYDYLLMGTSVTANFTLEPFQQRLPGQTRKLIVQGGYFEDFLLPLDVALETHTVRQVFWGVDSNCWRRYDKENTWEAPTYLFDENLYNDVHYLLSKDTFFWYIPDILRVPGRGTRRMRGQGDTCGETMSSGAERWRWGFTSGLNPGPPWRRMHCWAQPRRIWTMFWPGWMPIPRPRLPFTCRRTVSFSGI